jgi:dihydroorotase/N-acyl-D-amino-acid deacylase
MRAAIRLLFVVVFGLVGSGARAASSPPYDIVIRNGHVIDGTGSPWYAADIAIKV